MEPQRYIIFAGRPCSLGDRTHFARMVENIWRATTGRPGDVRGLMTPVTALASNSGVPEAELSESVDDLARTLRLWKSNCLTNMLRTTAAEGHHVIVPDVCEYEDVVQLGRAGFYCVFAESEEDERDGGGSLSDLSDDQRREIFHLSINTSLANEINAMILLGAWAEWKKAGEPQPGDPDGSFVPVGGGEEEEEEADDDHHLQMV